MPAHSDSRKVGFRGRLLPFDCSFIDHKMSRALKALERSGRRDDSIVVVTADHGDMLASTGCSNKAHTMYKETDRVPLLSSGASFPTGVHERTGPTPCSPRPAFTPSGY